MNLELAAKVQRLREALAISAEGPVDLVPALSMSECVGTLFAMIEDVSWRLETLEDQELGARVTTLECDS